MKIKQITSLIRGISLQQIPVSISLIPSDFFQLLKTISNEQLQQIEKLPLNLQLALNEIRSISIDQDNLSAEVALSTNSEKLLVPDIDNLLIDVELPYDIIEQKLQLSLPQVKTKITSSQLQNTIVNPILKQVLQSNESKLLSVIENKVNPLLSDPRKIKDLLSEELRTTLDHLLRQLDYEIHKWDIVHLEQFTRINCSLSISTMNDFKKVNQISTQIKLDQEQLIPIILEKINSDIRSKVEQDVSLTMINLTQVNTLVIVGRAAVMNIQKEFEIETRIEFDVEKQLIALKVADIRIDGGFLVRKGFELVKPKIKSMIETTAIVSISELLDKVDIPVFSIDQVAQYHLSTEEVKVKSISLDTDSKNWDLELMIASGALNIKRNELALS